MADAGDGRPDSARAKSDALALAEQAEAEAAEAEALAAAARARARAIRLRREAQAEAEGETDADEGDQGDEASEADEPQATEVALETPDAHEPTEPERAGRRLRVPNLSLALSTAAVLAIVGLLAASGWMAWQHHHVVKDRQRAAAYIATARQGVVNLTSLDFNKAKEDVQRVLDIATGEFKDDFAKRAEDFESVVKDSKAVTEGSVAATAVESMNKDSAVVLVLANERVTNIAGAKEQPRTFRFRVSVVHDGDDLKVSKVEFVL
ncbi:MAG: Mce-associated rane protein [Mycobacterium sp.]|nr:Mce-associated rane protein [Mycobacterium sp.]